MRDSIRAHPFRWFYAIAFGLAFSAEHSQVMICGNPAMVKETQLTLLDLGLAKNLRRAPGNISVENYW